VLAERHHLQIHEAVVVRLSINVIHLEMAGENASQTALNDKTMMQEHLAPNSDAEVLASVVGSAQDPLGLLESLDGEKTRLQARRHVTHLGMDGVPTQAKWGHAHGTCKGFLHAKPFDSRSFATLWSCKQSFY